MIYISLYFCKPVFSILHCIGNIYSIKRLCEKLKMYIRICAKVFRNIKVSATTCEICLKLNALGIPNIWQRKPLNKINEHPEHFIKLMDKKLNYFTTLHIDGMRALYGGRS